MALGLLGSYLSSSSEDEDDVDESKESIEKKKKEEESKSKPSLLSNPFGSTVYRPGPSYALEVHVHNNYFCFRL
jgi:hypothetical protein